MDDAFAVRGGLGLNAAVGSAEQVHVIGSVRANAEKKQEPLGNRV